MSITFNDYKNANPSKAGYFRIGHIVLASSVTDILTARVINNERLTTLRGRNDMVKKTGQGRWDVTVRWTALLDSLTGSDEERFQQWEDLRSVIAMFYAAPFVEVENGYIRQVLSEQDSTLSSSRMGFALRQLGVSTHNDIVDGLDISLTMTLFNYFPYSADFGYLGSDGQSVDAWMSPQFANYIDRWKAENMDASRDPSFDGSPLLNWKDQPAGTLRFKWRQYQTIKIGTGVATGVSPAALSQIQQAVQASSGKSKAGIVQTGGYDQLIQQYADKNNISAAMAKAVMGHESNFQASALGANWKNKPCTAGNSLNQITANLKSRIQSDADGGRAFVDQYTSENGLPPDLGLMQINWATAKTLNANLRPVDLFHPETNIALGCSYLAKLYSMGMADDQIYWYNTGPDLKGKKNNTTEQAYTADVLRRYRQCVNPSMSVNAPNPSPLDSSPSEEAAFLPTDQSAGAPGDSLTLEQKQMVMAMVEDGWAYDHAVNDVAFFYKEQQMTLTDQEHGDIDNGYNLYPTQFSILFVNNIAQIPLAAYQYPTYQHIGSTSAKISIGLLSNGERKDENQEPVHEGISTVTGAVEFLEAQYLRLRNSWRRVSSVHRMQAFYVENQIMNMLGIRGMLIDSVRTSSLPNMSNVMQVSIDGAQYENIFEDSQSYKINMSDPAVGQKIVASGAISGLTPEEKSSIPTLVGFSDARASHKISGLFPFLQKLGKLDNTDFTIFDSLKDTGASNDTIAKLMKPFAKGGSGAALASEFPSIMKRINLAAARKKFTVGDAILLQAMIGSNRQSGLDFDLTAADNFAEGLTNYLGMTKDILATYDLTYTLMASYDSGFANDINQLANSPKFSSQFSNGIASGGPGSDPINKGHGAYRDLGLNTLTLNGADFNPGYYFYNHNKEYLAQARKNLEGVVNASQDASAVFNKPSHPDSYDITITENLYVGRNADVNSLVRMTNIPGYDMAEAFPTYKLFIMEDAAPGLVQAFDNFYSYASVLDIEVIRYLDQPDLARIQITNLANILQHKLIDNSARGKWEYEQYKKEFFSVTPSAGGVAAGGDAESIIVAGKTVTNQPYQVERLSGFDLRDGTVTNKVERVPLQYAVLQPGVKIQVRFGYSNNPDLLTPVFTGHVTGVQGEDILEIEAESYLGELADIPVRDDKPVAGKTYGGWQPWHDSGDVISVVENLLKTDGAKHFGAFKLAALSDPLIQGMTWQNRLGKMIGEFSVSPTNEITRVGSALANSMDRSGENILINHVINHQGDVSKKRLSRDWDDDQTGTFHTGIHLYTRFDYRIPDNSTKTTWEYIKDITRRYPEFMVMAKQYGFPYSADATLVVAHPLDWYHARERLLGDDEKFRAGQNLDAEFQTWWNAQGKQAWDTMLDQIKRDRDDFVRFYTNSTGATNHYPANPAEFYDRLTDLANAVRQFFGISVLGSNKVLDNLGYLDQLLGGLVRAIDSPSLNSGVAASIREIVAVRTLWESFVEMQNPTSADLLKPVRRYHFIDHQSIVHNGMRLNEKIYNAIRIGSKTHPVNAHIPSSFTRVLDVTDLLVDPENNVENSDNIVRLVAQSFMKEEVGKMYDGELVLRGIPEIEPGDCLVLLDPSTSIVGVVEVNKVIQSFNQETGYTTIVYPRAVTAVNESASASVNRMFIQVMAKTWGNLRGLADSLSGSSEWTKLLMASAAGAGGALGAAGKSLLSNTASKVASRISGSTAIEGEVVSSVPETALLVTEVGTAGAAETAGVGLIGTPPGWVVLSLAAVALFGGVVYTGFKSETANMLEVLPVTRFGRPWIGGLEGYQIGDFWESIESSFQEFKADNIYPLLDTYRFFKGASSNTLPVNQTLPAPPQPLAVP